LLLARDDAAPGGGCRIDRRQRARDDEQGLGEIYAAGRQIQKANGRRISAEPGRSRPDVPSAWNVTAAIPVVAPIIVLGLSRPLHAGFVVATTLISTLVCLAHGIVAVLIAVEQASQRLFPVRGLRIRLRHRR
jgi:hypothetical protein